MMATRLFVVLVVASVATATIVTDCENHPRWGLFRPRPFKMPKCNAGCTPCTSDSDCGTDAYCRDCSGGPSSISAVCQDKALYGEQCKDLSQLPYKPWRENKDVPCAPSLVCQGPTKKHAVSGRCACPVGQSVLPDTGLCGLCENPYKVDGAGNCVATNSPAFDTEDFAAWTEAWAKAESSDLNECNAYVYENNAGTTNTVTECDSTNGIVCEKIFFKTYENCTETGALGFLTMSYRLDITSPLNASSAVISYVRQCGKNGSGLNSIPYFGAASLELIPNPTTVDVYSHDNYVNYGFGDARDNLVVWASENLVTSDETDGCSISDFENPIAPPAENPETTYTNFLAAGAVAALVVGYGMRKAQESYQQKKARRTGQMKRQNSLNAPEAVQPRALFGSSADQAEASKLNL